MERIVYRKTLDVHKNGVQFTLQGFETADKISRVIEISLMASGDAIDFPLEGLSALMYVTTPSGTQSINSCTIKDNKVVYEVLPIVEEGITTMEIKLIEGGPGGAERVLMSGKFAAEVSMSEADDESAEQTPTFTALEDAVVYAKETYNHRLINIELSSDCMFRANYADGTYYETDVLQKLFLNGNVELSKSYAMGGTGMRAGEDTDNSKYYSNVSKSEALNAKSIMENSEEILEEVRLHGVYTAFTINFETGEMEYVSPSSTFKINGTTGELEVEGKNYTIEGRVTEMVNEYLESIGVTSDTLINILTQNIPVERGGTGATNMEDARDNLSVYSKLETCSPATAYKFGLTVGADGGLPKPDDVFNAIAGDYTIPRMYCGEYTGDGKCGKDNPTIIPCPFKPTMLFIKGDSDNNGHSDYIRIFSGDIFKGEYTGFSYAKNYEGTHRVYIKYVPGVDGETGHISLYNHDYSSYQQNSDGTIYYYYIFGYKGGNL